MKIILTVVGARPQFVKASVVSKALKDKGMREVLVHTGQHYDYNMSDIFFKELGISAPDYSLEAGSGNHGEMTAKMLAGTEKVLLKEKPDAVLVYGDTNSTLAGALAASKLNIPVAHVEAGLRSFNREMPEEINRVLTDHVSEYLFAPTVAAVNNLAKEGITRNVYDAGDVMFDIAMQVIKKYENNTQEILNKYGLLTKEFVLVTIHRADNTDDSQKLKNIWEALNFMSCQGLKILFTVHPRTMNCLKKYGFISNCISGNLVIAGPLPYSEMIIMEKNAKVIITDSGGVQKESYFFKTPTVIPRSETEWVEINEAGWSVLTGSDKKMLIEAATQLYANGIEKDWHTFYGNGKASQKIADILAG